MKDAVIWNKMTGMILSGEAGKWYHQIVGIYDKGYINSNMKLYS
ncbi:MAG: hypothetical protein JWQ66_1784 [Mucilaginibacter sp.]|nr:hypothetical protein [Mucilaginibacter sp.]